MRPSSVPIRISTELLAVRICPVGPLHGPVRATGRADPKGKRKRCGQAGPKGPACSIVSVRIPPSSQGPAPDTSSASASPTLTALAPEGRAEVASTNSRCP